MTDNALILAVARAQTGDARAFDILVRRFQNMAVGYARTLLGDPMAAEDAAQEAFVQAWRDLPRLADAAAFGPWLRRIVFKFCDRIRRSARPTLPLNDSFPLPTEQEPLVMVERADEAATVRAAIDGLPCHLREATLLYYLAGHDTKEIAAFLELPLSTVKNRLHAARKRLRKELWTMAEKLYEDEKPSQTETFAKDVLARVLREFKAQEAADPHTVDRGLLDEGQTALFEILSQEGPLDTQTVRDGFILLCRKGDWMALAALLMRFLNQPLADSWIAWAYLYLAHAVAASGSAAGAVLAHEAFERWLPGKSPRLSVWPPHYPADEDKARDCYVGQEICLLFLGLSAQVTTAYLGVWRNADYLAKVDAALSEIPAAPHHRAGWLNVLRWASNACQRVGDFDRAERYVQQIHKLALGIESEVQRAEIEAAAHLETVQVARAKNNEAAFMAAVSASAAFLNRPEIREENWVRGERHDLACQLVWGGRHELALPLWEANESSGGQIGGWGWLMYAATVWQLTSNKPRVFALLQEARAHDDRDMTSEFVGLPEFADVREDAEFLQAVSRK